MCDVLSAKQCRLQLLSSDFRHTGGERLFSIEADRTLLCKNPVLQVSDLKAKPNGGANYLFGWKLSPLTRLLLVSNLVSMTAKRPNNPLAPTSLPRELRQSRIQEQTRRVDETAWQRPSSIRQVLDRRVRPSSKDHRALRPPES